MWHAWFVFLVCHVLSSRVVLHRVSAASAFFGFVCQEALLEGLVFDSLSRLHGFWHRPLCPPRPSLALHCVALLRNALHCTALHSIALHCLPLRCIALHCIPLRCIALHCIALHCIANCIALHCVALHCIALRCVALHCIALHCMAWHGMAWHGIAWHGIALHCVALQCWAVPCGVVSRTVAPGRVVWRAWFLFRESRPLIPRHVTSCCTRKRVLWMRLV